MPTISGFQKVLLQNPHLSERRGKHDYTHTGDDNQMAALYSVCRRGKTNVLDYHTFSPLVNVRVTQLYTARTCMERERNQWGSSSRAQASTDPQLLSGPLLTLTLASMRALHKPGSRHGSPQHYLIDRISHRFGLLAPLMGNTKDPHAFCIELWKSTWGRDATTFAS